MHNNADILDKLTNILVIILPFIPIILYSFIFSLTYQYQLRYIENRIDPILNMRMSSNLTLAGFNFTVIALLLNLYQKNELKIIYYPLYYFSVSLTYFLLSYIILHLRLRNTFEFVSDAFTISGLWTIIAGLYLMFCTFEILRPISLAFQILLIIFVIYMIIDCKIKYIISRKSEG
jgi:hypothetical protein